MGKLLDRARLERVGVQCMDEQTRILRCMECGQGWQPLIRPGGGFQRGWWKCPNRCNWKFQNISHPRSEK